jgi:DNA-binding MarR family transcriptional regulator
MADIMVDAQDEGDIVALIELLFFAYRDFIADPDEILAKSGFGRAHHRVVHFVGRNPGMTVAGLLDILRITKQSLARVLKDLVDKGYVYQKEGDEDRRQRLLFLSQKGEALRGQLMSPQIARIRRALDEAGPDAYPHYRRVLTGLIEPENRESVGAWIKDHRGP